MVKKSESDKSRRGGMADAADSKSVNGNIVRVQVPPPALSKESQVTETFLFDSLVKITKKIFDL